MSSTSPKIIAAPVVNGLDETPRTAVDQLEELIKTVDASHLVKLPRLTEHIKAKQKELAYHQLLLASGSLQTQNDLKENQRFLKEEPPYIEGCWKLLKDLITEIRQAFFDIHCGIKVEINQSAAAIIEWKNEKLTHLLGGPADNLNPKLVQLQEQMDKIESHLCTLMAQMDNYIMHMDKFKSAVNSVQHERNCQIEIDAVSKELNSCKDEMRFFITRSMIVYEEPPSIARKGAEASNKKKGSKINFDMELRIHAGAKQNLIRENMLVEALLISEQQALDITQGTLNPWLVSFKPVGKISGNECILKKVQNEKYFEAKFVDAKVVKVENDAEDDVSRLLYHVLFRIKQKNAHGVTVYCPYWAISLPFSVVINANRQEKYKKALMFWHYAFDTDHSRSISITPKTEFKDWPTFFSRLNTWFKRIHPDGKPSFLMQRGLEEHKEYLKSQLGLRGEANSVSWDMFYKRKPDPKLPTFWDWLYGIVEYVTKYPAYWESGLILGFAPRLRVEKMLEEASEPSMVLKFSDSRPGKMVASYVAWDQTGTKIIQHVMFDEKDEEVFKNKNLVECIRMSPKLTNVKRILPSNRPVGDFYALESGTKTASTQKTDGYVKPGIVFVWGDQPAPPTYEVDPSSPIDSLNGHSKAASITSGFSTDASNLEPSIDMDFIGGWTTGTLDGSPSNSGISLGHSPLGSSNSVASPPAGFLDPGSYYGNGAFWSPQPPPPGDLNTPSPFGHHAQNQYEWTNGYTPAVNQQGQFHPFDQQQLPQPQQHLWPISPETFQSTTDYEMRQQTESEVLEAIADMQLAAETRGEHGSP